MAQLQVVDFEEVFGCVSQTGGGVGHAVMHVDLIALGCRRHIKKHTGRKARIHSTQCAVPGFSLKHAQHNALAL